MAPMHIPSHRDDTLLIELRIENEGNEENGSDAQPVPPGRHFINRML
jgi:hypothetical protein